MSLFSEDEKNEAKSMIDSVHETFMKDITIYLDKKTTTVSFSPSHSAAYGRDSSGFLTKTRETQKVTGKARILHGEARQDVWSDPEVDAQLKIKIPSNSVRIRVDKPTYDILKEAKRVIIEEEGRRYAFASDFRPHGLFETRYYDCYLQVIDEEN